MATHPKVLGLTLDPKLTYSTYINNISVQAHNPLQMIKTLTATGWGKQKGPLMATYKAVMRLALEYASTIWSTLASLTSINKLQVMQNAALHKHTAYFNTPRLKKNTIFNNGRYTTIIPTDPHTIATTYIKTNMRHIHTSIASRHRATRGNNKILRTPPPHISSFSPHHWSHPCLTQNK